MEGTSSLLDCVEQAYRLDLEPQAWLEGVLAKAAPLVDEEREGALAAVLDTSAVDHGGPSRIEAFAAAGLSDRAIACFAALASRPFGADVLRRFSRAASVGSLRAIVGPAWQASGLGGVLQDHGLSDGRVLIVGQMDQRIWVLAAPCAASSPVGRRRRYVLGQIAAHVGAALRLRYQRAPGRDEALFDPDGRGQDAQGLALEHREALRQAVIAHERARRRSRGDSEESALEWWRALVEGRWSLLDRFDSDGRRFVVARVNELEVSTRPPLSPREQQVVHLALRGHGNKLIAYELGLAVATVASHLARALAKLGLRTRADLFSAFPVLPERTAPTSS